MSSTRPKKFLVMLVALILLPLLHAHAQESLTISSGHTILWERVRVPRILIGPMGPSPPNPNYYFVKRLYDETGGVLDTRILTAWLHSPLGRYTSSDTRYSISRYFAGFDASSLTYDRQLIPPSVTPAMVQISLSYLLLRNEHEVSLDVYAANYGDSFDVSRDWDSYGDLLTTIHSRWMQLLPDLDSGWTFLNYDEPLDFLPTDWLKTDGVSQLCLKMSDEETSDNSKFGDVCNPNIYAWFDWEVLEEHMSPVASFTYSPENPMTGEEVTFDGSGSYDPNGIIVRYYWRFGDGATAEGEVVAHTYVVGTRRTYPVMLSVEDDGGWWDHTSQDVTVETVSAAPTMEIVDARMVTPAHLGADLKVGFPADSPPDGRRKIRFLAEVNHRLIERTFDITQLIEPGETKEISFDYGSDWIEDPVAPRMINFADHGVPRFEENQIFTLRGIAYCDDGGQSEEDTMTVEVLLPVLVLHGYTYTHRQPFLHMIKYMVYDKLMRFLSRRGYTTDDSWYRTLWGPLELSYQADKETAASILSLADAWVSSALERTYADKANIVGHSTGGLVGRYYAGQTSKVNKLIMVGTPHLGVTDFYRDLFRRPSRSSGEQILKVPGSDDYNLLLWFDPSYPDQLTSLLKIVGDDGTIEEMPEIYDDPFYDPYKFNPRHNPSVRYYSMFANHIEDTPYRLVLEERSNGWYAVESVRGGDGDGLVMDFSASGFFKYPPPVREGGHAVLCEQPTVMNSIYHLLTGKSAVSSGEMVSEWHNGMALPSGSATHGVSIDAGSDEAEFSLAWGGSDLDLVLYDPIGREINAGVAADDPEIDYFTGDTYEQYIIRNPLAGEWVMEIRAIDVPAEGEEYTAMAHMRPNAPPAIIAEIDVDPNTLNLANEGRWITCCIELPEGYNVGEIDVGSIMLNEEIAADEQPAGMGDSDSDDVPDLMVKFDRQQLISMLEPGRVTMQVTGELFDGEETIPFQGTDVITVTGSGDGGPELVGSQADVTTFSLFQNEPNPFHTQTLIAYTLAKPSRVKLGLYDVQGRCVRVLVDEHQSYGHRETVWDGLDEFGRQAASGIYFYKLTAGDFVQTRKALLVKH